MKNLIYFLYLLISFSIGVTFALPLPLIKPLALQAGDTVGLISSSSPVDNAILIKNATERLQALGLKVQYGKYLFTHQGYLAGSDQERAADLNAMFADPNIKAIIEIRGGTGSDGILPYLNYKLIAAHPKILMGYSDITSLLITIYERTGLITFHGPMPALPIPAVTAGYIKDILFSGAAITLVNPPPTTPDDDLIQTQNAITVITSGTTTGRLMGGNLTILTSLLGTPYQPDFQGAILFVEDVDENLYRIDRMLTQLENAGVLKQISGFIFGQCINCGYGAGTSYGSLTFKEILDKHIKPLHIPAWSGAMFGHQNNNFVLPEGLTVKINADNGSIQMLSPAVTQTRRAPREIAEILS